MPKTKDDLGLVIRAAQFAAQKHKDQRRKDVKATPYINHPINLAEVLYTDGGVHDPIVIAAALFSLDLHLPRRHPGTLTPFLSPKRGDVRPFW